MNDRTSIDITTFKLYLTNLGSQAKLGNKKV
jgi:hypothetical protein